MAYKKYSAMYSVAEIENFGKKILACKQDTPIIIAIAGGSSVGKSSIILPYLQNLLQGNYSFISQDYFMLGSEFLQKDTTLYRWDDPQNFAPDEYARTINTLKQGKSVAVPVFSLHANKRVGTKQIKPAKYIICDGLYTLHNDLASLSDISLYVEGTFYARFLKRLFRFTCQDGINIPEIPIKHMVLSVNKAHQDFVIKQKGLATMSLFIPYTFIDTMKKFNLHTVALSVPDGKIIYSFISDEGVMFQIYKSKKKEYWFLIIYADAIVYKAEVTQEIVKNFKKINMMST